VRRQVVTPAAEDDSNLEQEEASVNEAEEVDVNTSADNEAETVSSYNLRSRQTRGKMFLTYNPTVTNRIANNSILVSVCEDGTEVRVNMDAGVAPISNDFVADRSGSP